MTSAPLRTAFVLLLFCAPIASAEAEAPPSLSVDPSGRFLLQAQGTSAERPFFWLADTAWYLDDLCSEGEDNDIDLYLADRAARGFNVIQGPILIRMDPDSGALQKDCHGAEPLRGARSGALTLDEAHFAHIDRIVSRARAHGLYIALPVMWGQSYARLFSGRQPQEAYRLGRMLGQRYASGHVIWIVAGEYHKVGNEPGSRKVLNEPALRMVRQMARGLEAGHGGRSLMTVHPDAPRSSSEHWHEEPWLDFHMVQTYAVRRGSEGRVLRDLSLLSTKPVVNAEPAYEGRDSGKPGDPISPWNVRYEAYHSVFEGAFGHSYGHSAIWRMGKHWKNALEAAGGNDMRHLRRLMASRPFGRMHDAKMFLSSTGSYARFRKLRATRADDGSYVLIYFPSRRWARLDLSRMSGRPLQAWWFNPRDGRTYSARGKQSQMPFRRIDQSVQRFRPPTRGDWVLVLDDPRAGYPVPGQPADGKEAWH